MSAELRELERGPTLSKEEWITKFVNAIVREMRPGLARMTAVQAARAAWPQAQDASPRESAKLWSIANPPA